jgi:2-methylcitrate dehydratase
VPKGARVPGTHFVLDPIQAAFNIGTMIRWLDFNDTWLAAEWGHPSDNLGAILAATDYQSQHHISFTVHDVLTAMIKAYEIQGILALHNSFNRIGLDHVILVKIASTAVGTHLLGGTYDDIVNAVSQAFIDGHALRTYRHAPNTGSRKSWAAGDAVSRALRLAFLTLQGEKGYPSALTAKTWGFNDVLYQHQPLKITQPFGSYVMENILFKIAYPAEFHAQTAVECAIRLHDKIKNRLQDIEKIMLFTSESAIRIISKKGPLYNPPDRDHSLQYMVAIALIFGRLNADDYEDKIANDPRIDTLRQKMEAIEDKTFSRDYLDPEKRSIGNAIQIYFKDGSTTEKIQIDYPIGHRVRREEGIPLLINKFKNNLSHLFSSDHIEQLTALFLDQERLLSMPVTEWVELWRQ